MLPVSVFAQLDDETADAKPCGPKVSSARDELEYDPGQQRADGGQR